MSFADPTALPDDLIKDGSDAGFGFGKGDRRSGNYAREFV